MCPFLLEDDFPKLGNGGGGGMYPFLSGVGGSFLFLGGGGGGLSILCLFLFFFPSLYIFLLVILPEIIQEVEFYLKYWYRYKNFYLKKKFIFTYLKTYSEKHILMERVVMNQN